MQKNIFEDSWVCQEWVKKGWEEGFEQGFKQGFEQGLEEVRQFWRIGIEQVVKQHFPAFEALASEQAARMSDIKALFALLVDIACARDTETVRKLLLDAGKNS